MNEIIVDDLIGRPFRYGGRPPERELDCYGLAIEVLSRQGVSLPMRQFSEDKNIIGAMMSLQMDEWEVCERQPGAVLLIRILGVPCHVGVMINPFEFIHTWEGSGGVCIERISDWERRIVGSYRYKG